jgi:hypothetical protein
MPDRAWRLFDDYAVRWARGERPDAREYLDRAGAERAALVELIDEHLRWAPPPEPDPDLVAEIAAWRAGEPPLLELRRRRGRTRAAVVDALMAALGLDPSRRERVQDNYHLLETGRLRLGRVDGRVLAAVAGALGVSVRDLPAWPAPRPGFEAAMLRVMTEAPVPDEPAPREPDEVDRLFGIG